MQGASGVVRVTWVLDSGASMHMTGNRSLLEDIREGAGPTVSFADNSKGRTVDMASTKLEGSS